MSAITADISSWERSWGSRIPTSFEAVIVRCGWTDNEIIWETQCDEFHSDAYLKIVKYMLFVLLYWRSNAACTQVNIAGIQKMAGSTCAKADNRNSTSKYAVHEAYAISRVARKAGASNEDDKCFPGHCTEESEGRVPVVAIRDTYEVDVMDVMDEDEEKYFKTMSYDIDDEDWDITTEDMSNTR